MSSRRFAVIVPVFNEAKSLPELCNRIEAVFASLGARDRFDILFVNDGSIDDTEQTIFSLRSKHDYVQLISLRRNCGKALALMAGFNAATADVIITLDGDLQDRPEDIPAAIAVLDKGFDLVSGWRRQRRETVARKLGSRLYNFTLRSLTGMKLNDANCGFKVYRAEVIRKIHVFGHYHRYIPLIAHLAGFRVGEVPIGNDARRYGTSKFRTFRYQGFFDLLSILFTHRFGLRPLHFFGVLGTFILVPNALVIGYFTLRQVLYLLGAGPQFMVGNRPLLVFALNAALVGVLIFLVGFICDFMLHHQIGDRIDRIIETSTRLKLVKKDESNSGTERDV